MGIQKKEECIHLYFKVFVSGMQNKVYCMETKARVVKRDTVFKLKLNFEANTQYKKIEAFGWKVCDRINTMIKRQEKKGDIKIIITKYKIT